MGNMSDKCMFCGNQTINKSLDPLNTIYNVQCPNCGNFNITDEAIKFLDIKKYNSYFYLISGLLRERNNKGLKNETITTDNISNMMNDPLIPKTVMQKLNKMLLYYYNQSAVFGHEFVIWYADFKQCSIGYAHDSDEYLRMVEALIEMGFFKEESSSLQNKRFSITIDGLQVAEDLLTTHIESDKVFVAMGFKPDLLEAHKKAIQPACRECGFQARLITEVEHNEGITDKIIAEIKTSKFLIVDFTYNNLGAYFEAGYAQGRGLPVIRTCKDEWFEEIDESGEKKNQLHFDIKHYNIILWKNHDDLKDRLINRIKASIL